MIVWCEQAILPDGVAERVAIGIEHGRISSVTIGVDPPPGSTWRRGVSIAAAANAHSHAFHRALRHRSQTGRGTFWTWREHMYAIAERLDPESYHRLARAVFAEMAMAGYGVVGEFHYVHHQPGGVPYGSPNAMGDALIDAAAAAGIRITLLDTLYLHGGLGPAGYESATPRQRRFVDPSAAAWIERVEAIRGRDGARVGAAVHSVRAVDPAAIGTIVGWAEGRGAPLHAHVSEQPAENDQCLAAHGMTPTMLLAEALGPSFTAVHATHLTETDIGALGGSGSTVCLCATTERDLGDGVGPARRLLDAGANLAIGSDSHAVIDPFEESRAIELDERLVRGERGVLTTAELLAAMTGGHRSLGWTDAGSLAVGRRADLVTITGDSPRTAGGGTGSTAEVVVFGATSADVTHVLIDGVEVVSDRRHVSIDVGAELASVIGELVA